MRPSYSSPAIVLQSPMAFDSKKRMPISRSSSLSSLTPTLRGPPRSSSLLPFLALLLLTGLASYIWTFDPFTPRVSRPFALDRASLHNSPERWATSPVSSAAISSSSLVFNPEQELAAITSFITSPLHSNILPPYLDPAQTVNPESVLDFSIAGKDAETAQGMVEELVEETWTRNPVVLYGKMYNPATRELKSILSSLHIHHPSPSIIDVDTRDDASVLERVLRRLIPSQSAEWHLPILLISGKPVATSLASLRAMKDSGELARLVEKSGAQVGPKDNNLRRRKV